MKWKQIIVLVSLFGAYENILAQDAKTPITIEPEKKQALEPINTQPDKTGKVITRKSLNPDRLDFIGVPSVNRDSK